MFSLENLNFGKAIEYASIFESNISANLNLRSNIALSTKTDTSYEAEVMKLKPKSKPFSRANGKCYRCDGTNHSKDNCPYIKSKCFRCDKIGHIARSCKSKQPFVVAQQVENDKVDEECYILQDNESRFCKEKHILTVPVKLGNGTEMFQIDTGASVSLMNRTRFFNLFPDYKLQPSDISLKTYTKEQVEVLGMAKIMVTVNNNSKMVNIYVVNGNFGSMFGLEWLWEFKLNWQEIFSTQSMNNCLLVSEIVGEPSQTKRLQQLLESNKDIFHPGVGKINNVTVRLFVKEGTVPTYKRARPLALALVPRVSAELDRLESEGIITKVNFSNYATPVVPILKKDGSVRLCGDYKSTLNKVLNIDDYPIPNIDHLLTSLGNNKYYSKIDITQAYNHLEVHPDDRHLTTINTHRGLYHYNRLPFGIANAPAIWQRTIEKILNGIQRIAVFYDDIGIGTETAEEHFETLRIVFDRLKEFGIRINANKCSFFKNSIEYCGFKLSDKGIHTMEKKIEAIMSVKEPKSVTEVKSFLGLVTFYGKFIPNLSNLAAPLYNLLKHGVKFVFTKSCKVAFQKIKAELASDRVLVHYDPKKELILATDASPVGLGAVISHKMADGTERPIAYASRTLTTTEQKYSQVDKEALSIVFGIKRFYAYLYGRKFVLVTDHKPLVSIFHPSKELPKLSAMRMLHYAMYLQAFDYDIRYRRTTEHLNADTFSRCPMVCSLSEDNSGVDIFQTEQIETLPVTAELIAQKLKEDKEVADLYSYLKDETVKRDNYFGHPSLEYSLQNNCILWGHRVYIPKVFRSRVLNELHEGHQGIVKTKQLARSFIWWPGIDHDIEMMIKSCVPCQTFRNDPAKVRSHCWEYPEKPMDRVHVDYAGPYKGKYYLVVVDAYSKWLEVFQVASTTSTVTKQHLMKFFAANGLPKVLVSDNGTCFTSQEFTQFCRGCGIKQRFIAPYHPSTNGQAERNVQTIKNALKIALLNNKNVHQALVTFLFAYRKTAHTTTGTTPAKLFIGRELRSRLDLIKPVDEQKRETDRECNKEAYRKLECGDKVLVRYYGKDKKWKFGMVSKKLGALHYLVTVDGLVHRRHIDQLRSVY